MDVMIDLETLGLTPDSSIISIGAVWFDLDSGKIDKNRGFYQNIEWEQDRFVDMGTVEWWMNQSKDAISVLKEDRIPLPEALVKFTAWLPDKCFPWGNGVGFDITMLEDAYRHCGILVPWKYNAPTDCRTMKRLGERVGITLDQFEFAGTMHNALDDAVFQAEWVSKIWRVCVTDES